MPTGIMNRMADNARSDCPLSAALDLFGDRWTLLVIRDLAFRGKRSFSEIRDSPEGVATNILADRLERLEAGGIVTKTRDPEDGRRFSYGLTDKGKDLIPALVELIVWSAAHHEGTHAAPGFVEAALSDRDSLIDELRAALA
ncbi:MAG: winged helix-turn-helix transcriptional regulator [Gaiellaceae bacterium]